MLYASKQRLIQDIYFPQLQRFLEIYYVSLFSPIKIQKKYMKDVNSYKYNEILTKNTYIRLQLLSMMTLIKIANN